LEFVVTAVVTLLVITDPLGNVPFFLALTDGMDAGERDRVARRAVTIAAGVLLAFAFVGQPLLTALGITLPAFRIAGGILLFLVSVDMVFARQSGIRSVTNAESREAEARTDVAIFPLAVPLIAGPGAITSVLLLMGEARQSWLNMGVVIVMLLAVLGFGLLLLHLGTRLMHRLGVTGVNVIGRISGIILSALAVQFILDGLRDVQPALF